jgi:Zn-dependent peptidase ImmA (M78 family)
LLDKDTIGMVSRESERNELREVRANSFAANFLFPEEGVRQFVAALGKGAASRIHADIFDEAGVVAIDSRTDPATQEIQLDDVVQSFPAP